MKVVIFAVLLFTLTQAADASILDVFKDEQGRTKWQHVANFSGSVLIVLLSISLLGLFASRIKLGARNKELREIKKNLESTVRKRTENLNKSNRLLEKEVTEHKSTQTYLESILASMPSMLIGVNEQGEITHWNRTAVSTTGLDESVVLGKDLWEVYPSITVTQGQVKNVLETAKPEIIKHGQRGQYYFDITIYPLTEAQRGVVLVIENVTQRSLAENMLIQRDKMASMGELAETMAHDINAPLQGIIQDINEVVNELDAKDIDLETKSLMVDAIGQGQQASAVIDNLLAFSGAQGADKQGADLRLVMDHCIELAEDVLSGANALKFRDVPLTKCYQETLPELECYAAEIQQVFLSLFRQATMAMQEKRSNDEAYEPAIEVEIKEEFDTLWVNITHNGVPLSAAEQQDIFEPFVQHTTPVNPKPLVPANRLSFSYFIVTEHHDGEMAVTSGPTLGTSFHIQFHLK